MTYKVLPSHNQPLASLVTLSPQPRSAGVQATQRSYAPSGNVIDQGLYLVLVWDLLADATEYDTVLDFFAMANAKSANVTIYARDETYTWRRYNGVAVRPHGTWDRYRPRNVEIIVRNLEQLA